MLGRRRVKLVVAYDGTDFRGWAAQTGRRTVQSTLTEAVRRVTGEDVEIIGASRTDSGAHAKGQVCHFDTAVPIEPNRWQYALNRVLPLDLAVRRSTVVNSSFHSRFCADDRHYRYRIATGDRDPIRSRFAHDLSQPLDVDLMERAALPLVGRHDFRSYTEELDPTIENTVRELRGLKIRIWRDEVWIDIVGTAFLRGMMRRICGMLTEVGMGKRDPSEALLLTDPKTSLHLPVVLPARGLTLLRIRYGRHPRDWRATSGDATE